MVPKDEHRPANPGSIVVTGIGWGTFADLIIDSCYICCPSTGVATTCPRSEGYVYTHIYIYYHTDLFVEARMGSGGRFTAQFRTVPCFAGAPLACDAPRRGRRRASEASAALAVPKPWAVEGTRWSVEGDNSVLVGKAWTSKIGGWPKSRD